MSEQKYLDHVLARLRAAIDGADGTVRERLQTLDEQKRYIWENRDLDPQEIRSARENILNINAIGESAVARRQRLSRMLDSPYFGRIDFRISAKSEFCDTSERPPKSPCEGNLSEPIYIGISTFHDFEARRSLVHDWRAPIASMYYDSELGPAGYTSPAGEITGEITLKRQFRIRGGRIEYMFDSAVTVHDELLQRELSSGADERMRGIVATIQREQNRVIRDAEAPVLIIQGVAGSGKTSIALHRLAYLLYTQRDSLSSRDILIISPNKVFADYISSVLPELGEDSVPETGMAELLSGVLGDKYCFQTFFEQVEELVSDSADGRSGAAGFAKRIAFKSTLEFAAALDKYVLHLENNCFRPVDLKIKHITIPHEFIGSLFRRFHRMAIHKRFVPVADMIADELDIRYGITVTTAERNFLRREIRAMFGSDMGGVGGAGGAGGAGGEVCGGSGLDGAIGLANASKIGPKSKSGGVSDLQLYKNFFAWIGRPEMFRMRRGHVLEHADLAPLAYLRIALEGTKPDPRVKHLLIDEMQDYTPMQYRVINKYFTCRITLLGDAGQSIDPNGSSTAEMIQKVFTGGKVMRLCKSYRSTRQITRFAQRIRPIEGLEPVARDGEEVKRILFKTPEDEIAGIARMIDEFRRPGSPTGSPNEPLPASPSDSTGSTSDSTGSPSDSHPGTSTGSSGSHPGSTGSTSDSSGSPTGSPTDSPGSPNEPLPASRSLGIICKTEARAAALHERLCALTATQSEDANSLDINLLTSRSRAFTHGVTITSAHMAKGLEFDEVIVPHADARSYRTAIDRGMLYVAVTRAMHRLTLTHTGEASKLIAT